MRKKVTAIMGMMALTASLCMTPIQEVKAAKPIRTRLVDTSLVDANESVGEMLIETRGQYLQRGSSNIAEVGSGKISVGGSTYGQKVVSTIKVSVMVERLVGNSWLSYTSWSATKYDTYAVTTEKTLTVPKGYYYRVRCVHSANSDVAESNTSGILID